MHSYQFSKLQKRAIKNSVSAAKRFISIFHHVESINSEQQAMLASAHYTLATQQTLSPHRSKMHLNSTITLLQNIPDKEKIFNLKWLSLLANAYTKRAEQLEYEQEFKMAMKDYQRAFTIFRQLPRPLQNPDKLQLAQCAISIADLVVNTEEFEAEKAKNLYKSKEKGTGTTTEAQAEFLKTTENSIENFNNNPKENLKENLKEKNLKDNITPSFLHPLSYINIALENLLELNHDGEEIWTTLAYAHQIAGIALISLDVFEAVEAFRTAVAMAFKATPQASCRLLGDIYNSIGLLYEQQSETCPILNLSPTLNDNALIYFAMGLLFSPSDPLPSEENHRLLDYVFDIIYRVMDPFLAPVSFIVMRDFIDALIFAYYSVSDQSLPNQELYEHFKESDLFNTFAQHIFWLVLEYNRRCDDQGRLLEMTLPENVDLTVDNTDINLALSNPYSDRNVLYLSKRQNILDRETTEI